MSQQQAESKNIEQNQAHPQQVDMIEEGLNNWDILLEANFKKPHPQPTQDQIVFKSNGKWSLQIKRRSLQNIHRPVLQLIQTDFGLLEGDLEIEINNQMGDIAKGLNSIGVQFQGLNEQKWQEIFGLWKVDEWRVDVKDGNTTIVDFRNQIYHFVIFYQTAHKQ